MIPLRDDSPKGFFPFINLILIAVNIYIFFSMPWEIEASEAYYRLYGVIPSDFLHIFDLPFTDQLMVIRTLFSSLFLHGGFMHLLSNMLYLWIFGDNIEYAIGHFRYLFFYIFCGLLASATQIAIDPSSTIPMIGASGAISGILGAYLLKFPRNRVTILFIIFIFFKTFRVPAIGLLSFWFLYQVLQGIVLPAESGVAWFAHIGGFVFGLLFIKLFEK